MSPKTQKSPKSIAAVITAKNEAKTIAEVVKAARSAGIDEVIVVSDGSKDETATVAQRAGALVIELPENLGKSQALERGLRATEAELVVLLDADLIGLKPEHIEQLIEPIQNGLLEMTIGVFRGGKWATEFGNRATPFLSGQRAGSRAWFLSVPELTARRWPEPAITAHLERTKIRWGYVDLPHLKQVMKEQKLGFFRGFLARLRMYWQLLRPTHKKNTSEPNT